MRGDVAESFVGERLARPEAEKECLVEGELWTKGQHDDLAQLARHEAPGDEPRNRARKTPVDEARCAVMRPFVSEHPAGQHLRRDLVETAQLERDKAKLHYEPVLGWRKVPAIWLSTPFTNAPDSSLPYRLASSTASS